jgi:hypothetical protein
MTTTTQTKTKGMLRTLSKSPSGKDWDYYTEIELPAGKTWKNAKHHHFDQRIADQAYLLFLTFDDGTKLEVEHDGIIKEDDPSPPYYHNIYSMDDDGNANYDDELAGECC